MVLIVEDDPLSRRALQSLFVAKGYACRAVDSAEDALKLIEKSDEIGVALIDIDLPGMNGLQLLRQLQDNHPNLACMLMSANEHEVIPVPGRRAVPFLPKPLNMKQLKGFMRGTCETSLS